MCDAFDGKDLNKIIYCECIIQKKSVLNLHFSDTAPLVLRLNNFLVNKLQ